MPTNYEIGLFIQKQRKITGITQRELSDKLNISPQAVSKWENGDTLPDTGILLSLAEVLNTTVDKILSGGLIVLGRSRKINIPNIIEGLEALGKLKYWFGEKSTFYKGAIEGINQKMNIDFEESMKDDYIREVLLSEVIIQYLMDGYSTTKQEINDFINSEKMRNIIYKYIGEESKMDKLYYSDNKGLFDQISKIREEFKDIKELNLLPGEYLHLEKGKNYWANQIETAGEYCYGIAVDDHTIKIFTYEGGGENMKLIHEEDITNS